MTGATGEIGQHILPLLATRHSILALSRKVPPHPISNVKWVNGDLEDTESYQTKLRGVTTLIHMAAQTKKDGKEDYEKTNVEDTMRLLEAAQKKGVKNAIVFSSASVTQEYLSPYAKSKKKMEQKIRETDFPCAILRPTIVYGKNSRYIALFSRLSTLPFPFMTLPNSGKADLRPVHVDDAGKAVLALLGKPISETKTYGICPETPFTFRQIVELASSIYHTTKINLSVPHFPFVGAARFLEQIGIMPPQPLVSWACAGFSYRVNPRPFITDYRIRFQSSHEGLRACFTHWKKTH